MGYKAVHYIALRVPDLRVAEEYYCTLFAAQVAFREAKAADGWGTLPPWASWADADAAGITLQLCMVVREGLRLALAPIAEEIEGRGRVDHINVEVDTDDLRDLRERSNALHCSVLLDRPTVLTFDDRYGIRWELTTAEDQGSNGENLGRWLNVTTQEPSSVRIGKRGMSEER